MSGSIFPHESDDAGLVDAKGRERSFVGHVSVFPLMAGLYCNVIVKTLNGAGLLR